MKTTLQQVKVIVLGILLAFGFSYVYAWNGPGNGVTAPNSNVSAPLNIGGSAQGKLGALAIGSTTPTTGSMLDISGTILGYNLGITGSSYFDGNAEFDATAKFEGALQIANGTQGPGKVLESDVNGNATWVATSSLNIAAGGSTGVSQIVASHGISISSSGPAGTGIVTISTTTVAAVIPSGIVGGGCYETGQSSSQSGLSVTFTDWGNATAGNILVSNTGHSTGTGCTCPSLYTAEISSVAADDPAATGVAVPTGYMCVRN